MWIDGLKNVMAFVAFNRQCEPRLKIEHSFAYPGMTAGVCWSAQTISSITATSPILFPLFEQGVSKQGVHLSKQFVKECDSSLLLMIDSHHQQ